MALPLQDRVYREQLRPVGGTWHRVDTMDDYTRELVHYARRMRTRMSGTHPEAVLLVSVASTTARPQRATPGTLHPHPERIDR